MKKLRARFYLWLMHTGFYRWVLINIIPYIRFSPYYVKLRGHKFHKLYPIMRPGMFGVCIDYNQLSGKTIPKVTGGISSHAFLCIGHRLAAPVDEKLLPDGRTGGGREIVEMTHQGFVFSDLFDICKSSERVLLFECDDWDDEYKVKMILCAISFWQAIYDVEFDFGIRALYCSELILMADKLAAYRETHPHSWAIVDDAAAKPRIKASDEDLMGLGRKYISPDGLACAENVRCVVDSDGILSGCTGPDIKKLIFGGQA